MKLKLKRNTWWQLFLLLIFALDSSGCKNDDDQDRANVPFNPSQKIEIAGFNPESAGGGADFFIYGTNFGTDPSIISVQINDKTAQVIGADGTTIYCLIPQQSGIGKVKVTIGTEETGVQEAISSKDFQYKGNLRVGTLSGWVDRDGASSTLDGTLEKAQYDRPYWMIFDETKENIFLIQEYGSVRKISLNENKVETLFNLSGDLNRPRTLSFSPDYDTLYIANDRDNLDGMAVAYALKKDGYKKWARLVTGGWCNGAAAHPKDGTLFYNSYELGQLYKWEANTQKGELLYRVGDKAWEFNIQFEPNGDYAYLVCKNNQYILKAFYDKALRTLNNPSIFVGKKATAGYSDGVGTSALFNQPHQGCFDKEGNFYLCDMDNHCIRKITPDGLVTTFAGRPNEGGYSDGSLRNQAQFKNPSGILYDEDKEIFYIADENNHRIRTIKDE